jgi:hypothetical protein
MTFEERKKLQEIFNVLDDYLGDTDPYLHPADTNENIKREEPIFWVAREINTLLIAPDR